MNHLTRTEWVFGLSLLFLLGSFFVIAKTTSFRSLEHLQLREELQTIPLIAVEVSGSIQKPGVFQVPQGSTIRTLVRKARLKPTADCSGIDLDHAFEESGSLFIPALEKIIVEVQGCVEENVSLEMPAGSRISDLKGHVNLTPDADPAFFRRRKMLKNNEIIQIPPKKG